MGLNLEVRSASSPSDTCPISRAVSPLTTLLLVQVYDVTHWITSFFILRPTAVVFQMGTQMFSTEISLGELWRRQQSKMNQAVVLQRATGCQALHLKKCAGYRHRASFPSLYTCYLFNSINSVFQCLWFLVFCSDVEMLLVTWKNLEFNWLWMHYKSWKQ